MKWLVLIASLLCGFSIAKAISVTPSKEGEENTKVDSLGLAWWFGIIAVLTATNWIMAMFKTPIVPAILVGVIFVITFLATGTGRAHPKLNAFVATFIAISVAVTLLFCLMTKFDRAAEAVGETIPLWKKLVAFPTALFIPPIGTFLIGKIRNMREDKKARLKAAFKPANIATAIIAIAAIVMVVWLCKTLVEVF